MSNTIWRSFENPIDRLNFHCILRKKNYELTQTLKISIEKVWHGSKKPYGLTIHTSRCEEICIQFTVSLLFLIRGNFHTSVVQIIDHKKKKKKERNKSCNTHESGVNNDYREEESCGGPPVNRRRSIFGPSVGPAPHNARDESIGDDFFFFFSLSPKQCRRAF